jgi:PAS domain S-box-containing protein
MLLFYRHRGISCLTLKVCLLALSIQAFGAAQNRPTRRVLILNEAGTSYPAINLIDQGIRTVLGNSPYQIEFYREYLETILFPDPVVQQELRNFYIRKYQVPKPDVIVTVGPSPLRFMSEVHEKFFQGIPIIFCLLDAPSGTFGLDSDFTGVEEQISPVETLEAALRLQPGTKHVIVVGGVSDFDREQQAVVRDRLKSYENRLDISYLTHLALPALMEQLKHLPDHTVVLLTSIGQIADGTVLTSAETGPIVATEANAPVFSLFDVYLNHGEVGGDVSDTNEQGKTVGRIALRLLAGEKPKNIPIVKGATTYTFDSRALNRWKFSERNLPPASLILNREPSFWERYKQYVIVSLLVFLAQALLIAGLLRQRMRRKRMEEALKKTEEKFRMAFLGSPLAVSIARVQDNCYLDVNETFARNIGWKRDDVVGRTPFDLGIWVDPAQRNAIQRKVVSDAVIQNVEFSFRNRSGEIKTGLGSFELIEIDGTQCILSVATDITERKQLEDKVRRALREGEERFRFVANAAPVMIWMAGDDRLCLYFNQRWLEFTGRPLQAELGNGWAEGVHPEDLDRWVDTYRKAFDSREPFQMEYRLRRHDGEYRWILTSGVPRFDADGTFAGYIGSAQDVTDHKRAQEALSTLSGRLIEAQEEERRHIARELHDDISQKLAVLSFGLQQVNQGLPDSQAPVRDRIDPLLNQITNISRGLRALSHRLHSSMLETLGLERAMRGFCRELAEQRDVKIDFVSTGVPNGLSSQVSLCLFRVLQEGLNNAVKYSNVRHFEVQLETLSDQLQLIILDGGVGFDPTLAMYNQGIGLISMRERVSLLKGTLSIVSKPGGGTEIKARVPLSTGTDTARKGAWA